MYHQLCHRFDHIGRKVLPRSGDGIFGFVEGIDLVRTACQGEDDRKGSRTDHRLDTVDPVDASQIIFDI